jgi:hypothetical protein
MTVNEQEGSNISFSATFFAIVACIVLPALYSDWALGIMLANLSGYPSSDNAALFWGYWVANLLTMGAI